LLSSGYNPITAFYPQPLNISVDIFYFLLQKYFLWNLAIVMILAWKPFALPHLFSGCFFDANKILFCTVRYNLGFLRWQLGRKP